MRTEPPPSDVVAIGTRPAASAAADPPLEPPGVRSRFHGLWVAPKTGLNVAAVHPYDGVFALPIGMAPRGAQPRDRRVVDRLRRPAGAQR